MGRLSFAEMEARRDRAEAELEAAAKFRDAARRALADADAVYKAWAEEWLSWDDQMWQTCELVEEGTFV